MVEVLKVGKWTPEMAILEAQSVQDTMDSCVVIWLPKGEDVPRITNSAIRPIEMNFFATALYEHSMRHMRD